MPYDARKVLEEMKVLGPNWDGMGAEAPTKAMIESAMRLLTGLESKPDYVPACRVVATPLGTILFEWQSKGRYEELEVVEPGKAEGMLKVEGEPTNHWNLHFEAVDALS